MKSVMFDLALICIGGILVIKFDATPFTIIYALLLVSILVKNFLIRRRERAKDD